MILNISPMMLSGIFTGSDQQLDRIETTTLGITDNKKKVYVLDHRIFSAVDTTKVESPAYEELARYLKYPFKTVSGKPLRNFGNFIDSGNGNATHTIYRICNKYNAYGEKLLRPIKGNGTQELFKKSKAGGKELIILNSCESKNTIIKLVQQAIHDEAGTFGTNIYFSGNLPDDYFIQLTSEKRVFKGGRYVWEKKSKSNLDRNEMLDCLAYALVAIEWRLSTLGNNPFAELRIYDANQRKKIEDKKDIDTSEVNIDEDKYIEQPVQRRKKFGFAQTKSTGKNYFKR